MAFQSVPETAEVVITYTGHAKEFKNVVHARWPGGYTLGGLVVLAAAVDLAIGANWLALQSSDYNYIDTTVRGLEFENDQETVNNISTGPGVVIGAGLPDNVTLSIKKSSGLTGRSARGRLYWIGSPATALAPNENTFNSADAAAIVAAIEAVRVALEVSAWTPVIVSRFNAGVQRPAGVTFFWTATVAVNNNVDSQRPRLL